MPDENPLGRRRRAPRSEPQNGEHGWQPTTARPEPATPPDGKAGASEEPKKST